MSIFRNTLQLSVQKQLTARQASLKARTPDSIVYSNSRSSWIRMSSSVNVNGTDILARQYILQGGVLDNGNLRYGVGGADKTYSNTSPSFTSYNSNTRKAGTAGIKPMPGIESIDIKSKSAYGSLREVVVNFKCHNLQQLEDLELLYMRPGYTVLVEWGWTPYLTSEGKLKNNIEFYDGVINGTKTREQVWLELYKLSIKQEHNYDALFGYVKNYNWTARMDGGYDCQTTIISVGEIMESLKVNYLPFDVDGIVAQSGLLGLLGSKFTTAIGGVPLLGTIVQGLSNFFKPVAETVSKVGDAVVDVFTSGDNIDVPASYSKNILAGILHEIYEASNSFPFESFPSLKVKEAREGYIEEPKVVKEYSFNLFAMDYRTNELTNSIASSGRQVYITLGSFLELLNKYVLLYAGDNSKNATPLVSMSSNSNTYESDGKPLLCLAHPLQVSIDPTVCLVTNPLWARGINFKDVDKGIENTPATTYDNEVNAIWPEVEKLGSFAGAVANSVGAVDISKPIAEKILKDIGYGKTGYKDSNAKDWIRSFYNKYKVKYSNLTEKELLAGFTAIFIQLKNEWKNAGVDGVSNTYDIFAINYQSTFKDVIEEEKAKAKAAEELLNHPAKIQNPYGVEYLTILGNNGKHFENEKETGFIENIYLNVDFLYRMSVDTGMQSEDQGLKLYDFLKTVLKEVQSSMGNVNNFQVHVDPIDSVARIIDLNYVDVLSKKDAYTKAFQIETQNLSGTVRSYSLQSQIFPEQSAMIAIGAQVKGGNAQGTSANTLLDFNNGLEDRIIPKKFDPPATNNSKLQDDAQAQFEKLKNNINKIKEFFFAPPKAATESDPPLYDQGQASEYKSALKDLIIYFQSIVKTNTNGRAIIPVKMSLTMDGIGGLVIGHLFKIPPDLLPKGYGSDNIGGRLIQTITGISHKIKGGEWTTTIDAQNIVTRDTGGLDNTFNDLLTEGKDVFYVKPNIGGGLSGTLSATGKIDTSKYVKEVYIPTLEKVFPNLPRGIKTLMAAQTQLEGFYPGSKSYRTNNPGNVYPEGNKSGFGSLEKGIQAQWTYVLGATLQNRSKYYKPTMTLYQYLSTYAPSSDGNNPTNYTKFIINYFNKQGVSITSDTTINQINAIK
jgi:hypothetical protein